MRAAVAGLRSAPAGRSQVVARASAKRWECGAFSADFWEKVSFCGCVSVFASRSSGSKSNTFAPPIPPVRSCANFVWIWKVDRAEHLQAYCQ